MVNRTATTDVDDPIFSDTDDRLDFLYSVTANQGDHFDGRGGVDVVKIAPGLGIDIRPAYFLGFEKLLFLGASLLVAGDQLVEGALGTSIEGDLGTQQNLNIFASRDYSAQTLTLTNWEATDVITIRGNFLAQTLLGTNLAETIRAGGGDDIVRGMGGDDTLYGEAGDDLIFALAGSDTMGGGVGNDGYWVDDAGDVLGEAAGSGIDTVTTKKISYTLGDNVENLNLLGNLDLDGTGNGENNIIRGNSGANQLEGHSGEDYLRGLGGNDVLVGGAGKDVLIGGDGADEFRFATGDTGTTGATADRVSDFSASQGDKLDLTETELSSFIGSGAFTKQAGEVRAVQIASGAFVVQGDADGNGVADFAILVNAGGVPLTSGDFIFG